MDTEAWQRLAAKLTERRASLRPDWSERTTFAQDTGLKYRSISDLETGRRANYKPSWLTKVELAYQWQPGSIQRVLDGQEPVPLEDAHQAAPASEAGAAPLAASASEWDGELRAPERPLEGNEVLRWRQTERGRFYRIDDGELGIDYTFSADETPEEVIEDLRDLLDQYRVNSRAM
ncbi:hypothetical protein NGM33_28380, partial [Nocardiopsis dassonvillei]|uniref:hypothetical protein n=1 Tax=Nocardiopsis dassonvillei TaxID=2014 RepID=UPI003556DFA8|nr:hypothetical protein [Nocardiopsis dassonvillei]